VDKESAIRALLGLQDSVNELYELPQYKQYVEQHKLSLIDGKYAMIDKLLDEGLLRVPGDW